MDISKKSAVPALLATVAGFLLASSSAVAGSPCYRIELKERPSWISGAVWRDDRQSLVLVDPLQDKLLAYSSLGEPQTLPDFQAKKGEKFFPTAVSPVNGSGYLLELANGSLLRLDKEFHPTGQPLLLQQKDANGYRVGSMNQWKVAGESLVAYGVLGKTPTEAVRGFFRVPLSGSGGPEMLLPLADDSFYLTGNSYITTIGSTAYFVAMDKHPAIYKVSPGARPKKLAAFPEELSIRPDFKTPLTGPKNAPQHYAELESFTVASGLYAQGGMLYLLGRKGDDWFLYTIDPDKDRLVSEQGVKLPTSAHHLNVVPTRSSWYFIERGTVEERQHQKIESMLVVDSSALASSAPLPNSCPAK